MSNTFVPQTLYENLRAKKLNFEKLLGYLSFLKPQCQRIVVKELFKEFLYLILLAKVGKVPALFVFL